MALAVRQTAQSTDGTSPTDILLGLAPAAGNLLIMTSHHEGPRGVMTPPAGWRTFPTVLLDMQGIGGAGERIRCWWKVADGTEGTTISVTKSTSSADTIKMFLWEISGGTWDPDAAIVADAIGVSEVAVNPAIPSSSIAVGAGLEAVIVVAAGEHSVTTGTPSAGVTEYYDEASSGGGNPGVWGGLGLIASTAGPYQPSVTWAVARKWLIQVGLFTTGLRGRTFAGEPGGGVW